MTLWNPYMYEKHHAQGGEISAFVRVTMHDESLIIIEEDMRALNLFCLKMQQGNNFSWSHDDELAPWFRTAHGTNRSDPERWQLPHLREVRKVAAGDPVLELEQDPNMNLIEYLRPSREKN